MPSVMEYRRQKANGKSKVRRALGLHEHARWEIEENRRLTTIERLRHRPPSLRAPVALPYVAL